MGWPTKTVDGKTVDDNAALDNADAVLIYADGGKGHPALQGDRMKVIDALAAKGVGLGFTHYGVEVPAGVPGDAMHRWIGGYYETQVLGESDVGAGVRDVSDHPVTRGVKPFATQDEWYFNMRWTPDAGGEGALTPILVAKPSDDVRKGPYVVAARPLRAHHRRTAARSRR